MQQGANALADGSKAIADGVQALVDQTKKLGSGLNEASSFLLGMKRDANNTPSMAGFNIPPQVLTADEFKKAAQIFISPDGHAARYFVQSSLQAVHHCRHGSGESRSWRPRGRPNRIPSCRTPRYQLAGVPTGLRDNRDFYNSDILFIVFATIIIVFLILVALLRAIVAPLYLIGSVLVSFLSALGIGVIVFQFILGEQLHWSLPGLTFILLVAIGADYNMLLISRIRDESPHGVRVGVIRTVGSTGGVITSAGLIFAASMFGLVPASISMMSEAGFIIGVGIVLDTFLVRTITVPALAALIGQANWWPSRLGSRKPQRPSRVSKVRLPSWILRLQDRFGRRTGVADSAPLSPPVSRPTTTGPSTNGHESDEPVGDHALPLFSLSAPVGAGLKAGPKAGLKARPHRLTDAQLDSTLATAIGDLPTHALPLFGPNPKAVNGNGHTNGHSNGHKNGRSTLEEITLDCPAIADDASEHALPLFGPTTSSAASSV